MSGMLKTRTKRSYSASDVREAIALDAERRPPSFSRQGHGHQPCACPCQVKGVSATVRCPAASAGRRLAPDVRDAIHPSTALVCWQVRGPRTAPMAAVLRHQDPGGARQAAPGCSVDDPGACPHHSPASRYHHAAHPQAALCAWQETIGRCAGSCSSWLPSGSVRQWRGGGQELAPSAVPMPRCAPRPGKARA